MEFKAEGTPVNIVLADMDVNFMMTLSQELMINPKIRVAGFATEGADLIERATSLVADAVLVNYSMPDMTAVDIVKELAENSPGTAVFVMSGAISAHLVMSAKSIGVVEVFDRNNYNPSEVARKIVEYVDELRKELSEVARNHGYVEKGIGPKGLLRKEKQKEREMVLRQITQTVVLTHSPKGGVGKSTIAANLAAAIKASPVLSGVKVALLDFDCEFGNLSTLWNVPPNLSYTRNIIQWEGLPESISSSEVDDLLVPTSSGVMLLPAPPNPAIASKVTMEIADKVLRILKRYYSVIIIDGGPKIQPAVDAAMQHATHILLIANPEGQSVENLSRVVTFVSPDPNSPEKPDFSYLMNKMYLVINRIRGSKAELTPTQIAEFVKRPIIAQIPDDDVVPMALHAGNGKQAVEYDPNSEFSIAIKKLANDIAGAYPMTLTSGKAAKGKVKKRKLFGLLPL